MGLRPPGGSPNRPGAHKSLTVGRHSSQSRKRPFAHLLLARIPKSTTVRVRRHRHQILLDAHPFREMYRKPPTKILQPGHTRKDTVKDEVKTGSDTGLRVIVRFSGRLCTFLPSRLVPKKKKLWEMCGSWFPRRFAGAPLSPGHLEAVFGSGGPRPPQRVGCQASPAFFSEQEEFSRAF